MSVPMLYENLTPLERAWMCNGCGPKLGVEIDVVPEFIFHEACNRHDFDYWSGFSKMDRYRADQRFRASMIAEARKQESWWTRRWYEFLSWRYYAAVRMFGEKAFSFRDHYATHEDLLREMAEDAKAIQDSEAKP